MTDLRPILAAYALDDPEQIDELKEGCVWRVQHASGDWVLAERPVYDPESRRVERFEAASALMNALNDAGQPWVRALPTRDGHFITQHGDVLYQVTTFVHGNVGLENASSDALPAIGSILGEYHRFQESSFDVSLPIHDFTDMTSYGLDLRRQECAEFSCERMPTRQDIDEALLMFLQIEPDLRSLPYGLIHMDLSAGNIATENGVPVAVFDFEAFCAPFLLDMGITALYWTYMFDPETGNTHIDRDRLGVLLRSYARSRPLSDLEKEYLKNAFVWSAIRKWSRQARFQPGQPEYRLHTRYDNYRLTLDLDEDWLKEQVT